MRVLVTGHEGYLGSVLVPRLTAAGHEVVGLDTGLFADCVLGPAPQAVPALRTDLRDVTAEQLTEVAPDAVMHLGALCNDPLGDLDPELTYDVNHRATVRLARAAKAAGVPRFLFSSSCSLYGAGTDDSPLDENAAFAPLTPYGESKIRSEQDLVTLADDDFAPVFLRNATAYGFSPRLRGDLVVNDLVGTALLTGEVRLRSNGMAWRPLVHAEDIAAAFLALLQAPRETVHKRAFNVGDSAENYLIRDVAELVGDVVEVRSEAEILATLDENGELDALPFMPEMLRYCGKRLTVYKVANKSCDTLTRSGMRKVENAVHLSGVRCDGSAHGGCQAACLIYWRHAWLRKVEGAEPEVVPQEPAPDLLPLLTISSHRPPAEDGRERYPCQATELPRAAP